MIDTHDEHSQDNPINQKDVEDIEVIITLRSLIEDDNKSEALKKLDEIEGSLTLLRNFFRYTEDASAGSLIGRKRLNEILEIL